MPIGTSKAGVLGAGVVPGGCQVFNSPGCFVVPAGVTLISSVSGSGTAGNPGNPGNPGGIGAGGAGGFGGAAGGTIPNPSRVITCGGRGSGGSSGGSGTSGNDGTGGAASSVFCLTFPGGAAGTGGLGGNSGTSGNDGANGVNSPNSIAVSCSSSLVSTNTCTSSGGNPGGGQSGFGLYLGCSSGGCSRSYTSYASPGGGGAGTVNPATAPVNNATSPNVSFGGNPGGGCGGGRSRIILSTNTRFNNRNVDFTSVSNTPNAQPAFVSGAGGGGARGQLRHGGFFIYSQRVSSAGGGGGGGRGGAGNPGAPGNAGACSTPTVHNCVSVVAGASYPVTANAPVTISWDPQ